LPSMVCTQLVQHDSQRPCAPAQNTTNAAHSMARASSERAMQRHAVRLQGRQKHRAACLSHHLLDQLHVPSLHSGTQGQPAPPIRQRVELAEVQPVNHHLGQWEMPGPPYSKLFWRAPSALHLKGTCCPCCTGRLSWEVKSKSPHRSACMSRLLAAGCPCLHRKPRCTRGKQPVLKAVEQHSSMQGAAHPPQLDGHVNSGGLAVALAAAAKHPRVRPRLHQKLRQATVGQRLHCPAAGHRGQRW
jgi:hypothetical protein